MPTTAYIATSLDGFIARPDGGIDWLGESDEEAAGEDYGYAEFMKEIDALVMGSNTYKIVQSFGAWPYGRTLVYVLTSKDLLIPDKIRDTVKTMSGTPVEIIERLAERDIHRLYIDGGYTIQQFLNAGLLDRIIVTKIPVLIGQGIPLFGPLEKDVKLTHILTKTFPDGLIQSEYAVAKTPPD